MDGLEKGYAVKFVIYALVLANLGFFLWHYRPGEGAPVALEPLGGPRLLRYGEAADDPRATPAGQCVALGPISRQALVEEVRRQVKDWGIEAGSHMTRDSSRRGYWVFLPPAPSRQAARDTVEALKAAGVKDYFVVVTGGQKNAISLGVFSRAELARRRLKSMKKKGFPAKIDRVPLPRREYWVYWPAARAPALDAERLARLRQRVAELGQIQQPCP